MTHTEIYQILSRDAMLARYILCDVPVLVRPSGWGQRDRATPNRAEGPASRRRRPRGLLLQTRSCGVVGPSMRPIAIGAMVEQPGGQRTDSALLL